MVRISEMAGYELRMCSGCGKELRDGWLRAENGGWGCGKEFSDD